MYKRQLPKSTLGVDTSNHFETDYVVIPGKEKVLARLKKLAGPMDAIYLAPDPDREGEAIAAHLAGELARNGGASKKKKKKKKQDAEVPDVYKRQIFSSPLPRNRASNAGGLLAARCASMVQYSFFSNALISRSRSTINRSATVCTRPAESPRRTLSQSSGETW